MFVQARTSPPTNLLNFIRLVRTVGDCKSRDSFVADTLSHVIYLHLLSQISLLIGIPPLSTATFKR